MTRRRYLTLGAALLPGACSRPKRSGYWGHALVATAGENSLAIVDLSAFRVLKNIPVGAPPTAVITSSENGSSYVLTPSTDTVHLIGQNLTLLTSRRLGDGISQIRISPDGRSLFALARRSRELIHADAASLRTIRRFKFDAEPDALEVSVGELKSPLAAVAVGSHGVVELLQPGTGERRRIQLPGAVGALRFRADGKLLLAALPHDRSITALTVPSLQSIAELPLAMSPDNLCFNADQGQLFVSGSGMDGIAVVFPYNTIEVEQTVLAGRDPGFMACSNNPSYLFVGSASGSDISVMNVDTRKIIALVDVGGKAAYIAITPDNRYALVFNESSGDMAVIHIAAIRSNRLKTGAALFTVIGVGSRPVQAVVVPRTT